MQDWTRIVRELYDCFEMKEKRLDLLHEIDRLIIDNSVKLEDLCLFVLENILGPSQATIGYFYIQSGTELILLYSSRSVVDYRPIPLDNELYLKILSATPVLFEKLDEDTSFIFPSFFEGAKTRVLVPIYVENELWGLMGLESSRPFEASLLGDRDLQLYYRIIAGQLEIAIQIRSQYNELALVSKIQSDLFTKELDISESLYSLVSNIGFALERGPFRIYPTPEIQILFYQNGTEYLTIKATTGSEPVNTRIFVQESISGLLIENPNLPFYFCDPRDYPERYKSYLGRDSGGIKKKEICAELVVPLQHGNRIIGVINLESENKGAFKIPHFVAINRLAERISPIVNALQKRIEKTQVQDKANIYAMKKFLDRFAGTYIHKMGSPIEEVSLTLYSLKEKVESDSLDDSQFKTNLTDKLQRCIDAVGSIDRYHHQFSKDLPDFLNLYNIRVNQLIQGARNDLRPKKLKEKDVIEVIFEPEEDYEVFCSLFLREHLYNILNNSVYAIRERKKHEPWHRGEILIETSLVVDEEERELNQRCRIRIIDNGVGLDEIKVSMIPNPFTTKPSGTGFGMSAAFQYLKSIGGKLEVKSEVGKFFEVCMYLDIYRDELHEKSSSVSAIHQEVE